MIQRQDEEHSPARLPRIYFYCVRGCGVCGPIRSTRAEAEADERAHNEVCSARTIGSTRTAATA